MALFNFSSVKKYRLNLCTRDKQESSLDVKTLQEAVTRAREALAEDILPTSIEKYSSSDGGHAWFAAWYPDDISGVYTERKKEIAASLEDFIKSNL
jgi:hypothetical protein